MRRRWGRRWRRWRWHRWWNQRMHSRSWWVWTIRDYADWWSWYIWWTHRYWWWTMFDVSGCLPRLRRSKSREWWSSFRARAHGFETSLGGKRARIAMITACPVWRPTSRPMPSESTCAHIVTEPAAARAMACSIVLQTTERRSLLHFILFHKRQVFAPRSSFSDFLGHFPIKRQF